MVAALMAMPLAGCVSAEQEKAAAIEKAQAHCAVEGKQFILKNATANAHYGLVMNSADAEVSGVCVGPGDPGYVAPPAPPPAV